MSSHGWSEAPRSARAQVEALLQDLRAAIGSNLSGLYLHGSLAMANCIGKTYPSAESGDTLNRPQSASSLPP